MESTNRAVYKDGFVPTHLGQNAGSSKFGFPSPRSNSYDSPCEAKQLFEQKRDELEAFKCDETERSQRLHDTLAEDDQHVQFLRSRGVGDHTIGRYKDDLEPLIQKTKDMKAKSSKAKIQSLMMSSPILRVDEEVAIPSTPHINDSLSENTQIKKKKAEVIERRSRHVFDVKTIQVQAEAKQLLCKVAEPQVRARDREIERLELSIAAASLHKETTPEPEEDTAMLPLNDEQEERVRVVLSGSGNLSEIVASSDFCSIDMKARDMLCMRRGEWLNDEGNHWVLAVINIVDKRIEYYDSMGGLDSTCLSNLKRYITEEFENKGGQNLDTEHWPEEGIRDIPHQQNAIDCGVFMLTYADYLSREHDFTFSQENIPHIRKRIVTQILENKAD
eukprot:gene17813-21213_t